MERIKLAICVGVLAAIVAGVDGVGGGYFSNSNGPGEARNLTLRKPLAL